MRNDGCEGDNPDVGPSKLTNKLSCEECDIEFVRYFSLKRQTEKVPWPVEKHFGSFHDIELKEEALTFGSYQEFLKWN